MIGCIPRDTERLAIICPSWIGDTVMATPVFRAARKALPVAHIVGVMRPGLDQVLNGTSFFSETMVCEMNGVCGPIQVGKKIKRSAKPQATLVLPNSFRSALMARFSGASIRIAYKRDGRGLLLTHAIPSPPKQKPVPAIEYYAALARHAFGEEHVNLKPELAVTHGEIKEGDELLREVEPPFVLLNPGANREDKRWPAERFAAVADRLAEELGASIVVTGSPSERDVVESVIRASTGKITNLIEQGVTLGSLKAVICRSALVITNDTGPRHLAAALGTPLVTLFGPTDHRWTTLPGVCEHRLCAEPFLPDELVADRERDMCSIDRIAVGDVVSAARSMLNRSRTMAHAS